MKKILYFAIAALSVVALWGALQLIASGHAEYGAAVLAAAVTGLAWLMKALADPDVPMVPASVVMAIIAGEDPPAGDGPRFEWRPNAMACLGVVALLALVGGVYLIIKGHAELGYGVIALGMTAAATTMTDLVKPADKDVPMPVAEQLIARLGPAAE